MCGIAGFVGAVREDEVGPLLDGFNRALAHRGPDGRGTWLQAGVGLAHTRLAIIDLQTGEQPMVSADARYVTVLNGEIYNYRALKGALDELGYVFRTQSDTEVISAALDAWGLPDGLRQLRGMFAVAVYDRHRRTLTVARDGFGIKPLYLAETPTAVVFASEIKALLESGLVARTVDPAGLVDFLTVGATVSPRTCWTGVEELVPGTWATFDENRVRSGGRFAESGWGPQEALRDEDWIDRVEQVLLDSCRHHLESDVPVGAFLSGGLDSSLLVAMLSRFRPSLDTFHVRFSEDAYDESRFARHVAEHCGTRHHELLLPAHEGTLERLVTILNQYDQPFGDSSAIPTWLISREIAGHVKVAVSGDGGDEIFGGYGRYLTVEWLRRIGRLPLAGRTLETAATLLSFRSPDLARRVAKLGRMSGLDPAGQLVALHTYLGASDVATLFEPGTARTLLDSGSSEARIVPSEALAAGHPVEQIIRFEALSLLHGDYLRKVDIASSAHGLEVRTPILDVDVARVGFRLPLHLRVGRGRLKYALRVVAGRYLPPEVVQKPKWGFGVPFDTWLQHTQVPELRDFLLGAESMSRAWLQPTAVTALLDRFQFGGSRVELSRYQVYQRVFMLIALESWLRRWRPSFVGTAA